MGIINAIFQAIIQGLTEFLPVSSSGHLSLYQHFTGKQRRWCAVFLGDTSPWYAGSSICGFQEDNMGYDKRAWRYDKGYFYRQVHS